MYKCAAYNPVTQEVKTSGSSDRLRVRRKGPGGVSLMEGDTGRGAQAVLQARSLRWGWELGGSGSGSNQDSDRVGGSSPL